MPPRTCLFRPLASMRPSLTSRFRLYSATAARFRKTSDPLKILFCGSDEFSVAALEALHQEKQRNSSLIESLDVVIRPGKPVGRGLKQIRQGEMQPIQKLEMRGKSTATQLGLPIHELNTFTGWAPSFDINLIIAVSFGLLVPPRLLKLAKYGGLNLHPSLLPDLRGPAPLHHTILSNRQFTGVTLQTLHESRFDHGAILAQTPRPGIPVPETATLQDLHDIVTPVAAEMLVQGLRDSVHVPPLQPVVKLPADDVSGGVTLQHAPKLTKSDSQVRWSDWTAADYARHQRVLGPLWSEATTRDGKKKKRIILEDVSVEGELAEKPSPFKTVCWSQRGAAAGQDAAASAQQVDVQFADAPGKDGAVLISALRGGYLRVPRVKVEGDRSKPAANALVAFARIS